MQIKTDTLTEEKIEELGGDGVCNEFAIDYVENENPDAVLKVSEVNGQMHCFVYDPDLDVTIDATARQFDGVEDGAWDGEENPNVDEKCRWEDEFETVEAFKDEFYGAHSPFYQ